MQPRLWTGGGRQSDVVQSDLRPAAWLRMWEFQSHVAREHLGLIPNVLDRDGDGWGEVVFALN